MHLKPRTLLNSFTTLKEFFTVFTVLVTYILSLDRHGGKLERDLLMEAENQQVIIPISRFTALFR